jgi:lipoate-protein ligase A
LKWYLIDTGFNPGKFNMDYDMELARICSDTEAYLRFYRWKPFCISLGANQNFEDLNLQKISEDKIDIVKRPTGGRAILHADEITYSFVIPSSAGFSSTEIYKKVSLSLVRGLKLYDHLLDEVELEQIQPDFAKLLLEPKGIACFASTAKSEVKFKGKKLIGSAQRRMNKVILQHGSILCGDFHLKLVNYLCNNPDELYSIKDEMRLNTVDLTAILQKEINHSYLLECLINGFQEEWDIKFEKNIKPEIIL